MINKHGFIEIQAADAKAYGKLIECKNHLKQDPGDVEKEIMVADEYTRIHECYLSFL